MYDGFNKDMFLHYKSFFLCAFLDGHVETFRKPGGEKKAVMYLVVRPALGTAVQGVLT